MRSTSRLSPLKRFIFTVTPYQLQEKYSAKSEFSPSINHVNCALLVVCVGSYLCLLSTRGQGLTPDQSVIDKHIADLSTKLDVYDNILSKQKYLVGDVRQFLLVDK